MVRYPGADLEGDARRVAEALGIPAGSVKRSTDVSGVTPRRRRRLARGARRTRRRWRTTPPPESAQALNGADDKACMHVSRASPGERATE
ncbi:hypothetical protein GCM10023238_16670 [Streptomyces heliomycini]